jgi:hypothetical protein
MMPFGGNWVGEAKGLGLGLMGADNSLICLVSLLALGRWDMLEKGLFVPGGLPWPQR